jgi:hypothetical protein
MAVHNRFVVFSHGPRGLTGKPNEKWFYTLPDAQNEVRRRLQVRRLNSRARVAGRAYPDGKTWNREDLEWRSIGTIEYRDVPQSNPDFERSGGCIIHQVHAITENKPFDPSSLFPPKPKIWVGFVKGIMTLACHGEAL